MKKVSILFSLFIFCVISGFAQAECISYHRKNCSVEEGVPMRYDSQSKSAMMGKGQASEFHLVAHNGLDYRITICNDELLGGQVQFRIFEKVKTLIKDDENQNSGSSESYDNYNDPYSSDQYSSEGSSNSNSPKFRIVKELLYDNANDSYANSLEFTAEGNKSLIIEIIVPGDSGGNTSKLEIREMGCVGVLIEYAKSRQSGF